MIMPAAVWHSWCRRRQSFWDYYNLVSKRYFTQLEASSTLFIPGTLIPDWAHVSLFAWRTTPLKVATKLLKTVLWSARLLVESGWVFIVSLPQGIFFFLITYGLYWRCFLFSIFPAQQPGTPPKRYSYPIVTIEEATSDRHGGPDDDEVLQEEPQQQQPAATPVKKARLRPLSEQLLGRTRPRATHDNEEGQFFSILCSTVFYSYIFHFCRSTLNSWCSNKRPRVAHQHSGFAGDSHDSRFDASSTFSFTSRGGGIWARWQPPKETTRRWQSSEEDFTI